MDTIVYKLRHIPTGLFYQPVKGRWSKDKSNLSKRGKLYETKQYPKPEEVSSTYSVHISESLISQFKVAHQKNRFGQYLTSNPEDWEVVEYKLIENK